MANCKLCLSEQVCRYNDGHNLFCKEDYECPHFKTADVVEVVRCKDCKHCFLTDFRKPNDPKWCAMFDDGNYFPNPTDFCSLGEKMDVKEGADNGT